MSEINYDDIAEAPVAIADDELKSIAELAERQIILEDWLDAQEERMKEAKKNYAKLVGELLPDAMRQAGVAEFTLANGCKIEVKESTHGSITKANQDWCFNWMNENGSGDLIKNEFKVTFGKGEGESAEQFAERMLEDGIDYSQKEGVNFQTLGAFIRLEVEREHGQDWEEKFGVFRKRTAKIERPKT